MRTWSRYGTAFILPVANVRLSAQDMDYLSYLPLEIWRDILIQVAPFASIPLVPSNQLTFVDQWKHSYAMLAKAQSQRIILLSVNKALHQVVEPMLYTELMFRREAEIAKFAVVASGRTIGGIKCTELTTSLFLLAGGEGMSISLCDIFRTFPNLTSLVTMGPKLTSIASWTIGWRTRLVSLTYTNLFDSPNALMRLALHLPYLNHLKLQDLGPEVSYHGPSVSFSSLKTLAMSAKALQQLEISRLRLPLLKNLFLEIVEDSRTTHSISSFLQSHGRRLIQLEYLAQYRRSSLLPISSLLDACPSLHRFTFDALTMSPELVIEQFPITQYHSLTTLRIVLQSTEYARVLHEHLTFFTPQRFPQLLLVCIVLGSPCDSFLAEFFRYTVEATFPDVEFMLEY